MHLNLSPLPLSLPLPQAANEAKGANARTKELTAWKRNVCNRACFVNLCYTSYSFTSRVGSVSEISNHQDIALGQPSTPHTCGPR